MDKETLSNYGWIVICVLVLAVMIALAGPFGTFVAGAVKSTTAGLFGVNQNALGAAGIDIEDQAFPACDHSYENYKCTQCGDVIEHTCNFENSKCTLCGKELPVAGKALKDYTWEEIKIISELGMGNEYFNTGDTKTIYIDGIGDVLMQIIAFDTDVKADGTGTAGITWLSKNVITTHHMNTENTNSGGWKESDMRSWLQNDVFNAMDSDIKNAIVSVDKTYYDYTTKSTLCCEDTLWIPSYREAYDGTQSYENSGVSYYSIRRIMYDTNGTAIAWWLRSPDKNDATIFRTIYTDASDNRSYASSSRGVVLGFCT